MQEEFDEEFIEEFEEVSTESDGYEELDENELDDTTGGGTSWSSEPIRTSLNGSTTSDTINVPGILTKVGVVDNVRFLTNNGARCRWGAGFFILTRGMKGTCRLEVTGHYVTNKKQKRICTVKVNFK